MCVHISASLYFFPVRHVHITRLRVSLSDSDGDMDVLSTALGTGLRYQLNNGTGRFGAQVAVGVGAPLGGNLSIVAPVDVDADGDVDLFLFQVCANMLLPSFTLVPAVVVLLCGCVFFCDAPSSLVPLALLIAQVNANANLTLLINTRSGSVASSFSSQGPQRGLVWPSTPASTTRGALLVDVNGDGWLDCFAYGRCVSVWGGDLGSAQPKSRCLPR